MKRIGILNLTRFGDLVQTSPLLAGLRKRHPDAAIELIVKSRFREIAELLPGVDAIHEIDGDALARLLADPEMSFLDAFRAVRKLVDGLAATRFDRLYNLTHSRASAVLMSLLDAETRVGYTIDREGLRHVENPWLAHMGTLVRARRLNRLNLVDLYLGAAGLLGCGERMSVRVSSQARAFAEMRLSAETRRLAVQLGASSDAKTWSLPRYAGALRALAQRVENLEVVLVGVPAEADAAASVVEACPEVRIVNLVGETDIPGLAAVLERCRLLLTGDTGTMHLAAAVGCRTCAIFVGLGTPWETAAYAEDQIAVMSRIDCAPCQHHVKCGFPACHDDVPEDWLADLLARLISGRSVDDIAPPPRADLFRTRFDEHGVMDLEPVHVRTADANDLLALALRDVFLEQLAGIPASPERICRAAQRRHGMGAHEWSARLPADLPGALQQLERLATRARSVAVGLARDAQDVAEAQARGKQLADCDEEIYAIARSQPLLAPLGLSLEGSLQGLPDADLSTLARASAAHYESLARGVALLQALFDRRVGSQGGYRDD